MVFIGWLCVFLHLTPCSIFQAFVTAVKQWAGQVPVLQPLSAEAADEGGEMEPFESQESNQDQGADAAAQGALHSESHAHKHAKTFSHTHTYARAHTHMLTHTHTHTHTTHTHTKMLCVCVHTHAHTYIHLHTHTHTHTHSKSAREQKISRAKGKERGSVRAFSLLPSISPSPFSLLPFYV
jgi:hypothetical protein